MGLKLRGMVSAVNNLSSISERKPALGIITRAKTVKKLLKENPLPGMLNLETANKTAGITLYYFSVEDIDMKKRIINGVYYNHNRGVWEKKVFEYPDFLYKRSTSSGRHRNQIYDFERQLQELNIEILNYKKGFNKWEVYQHLAKDENILPHLPLTVVYNEPADLWKMLDTEEKVYLKGLVGGRGRKIVCISKLPEGGYGYRYFTDKLYVCKIKKFNMLIQDILALYRGQKFLIQKAIDLIQIGKGLVDMRAEVQRGKNGELTVAAIPVRVGKTNAPITTHAEAYPFEYFFKNFMYYPEFKIQVLKERITCFLKSVYRCLEKAYGTSVEMGIDFGLDKNGLLWFIECNSRSMKVSLYKAYDENTINDSCLNILEYARFRYNNSAFPLL